MIEKEEMATSVSEKKRKSNNENHLFGQYWEGKTTSLIIFGVLVNVGKKIKCLQCGFKS